MQRSRTTRARPHDERQAARDAVLGHLRRLEVRRVAAALGLELRGGRGVCPVCLGGKDREATFSAPLRGGWRCHRASCNAKGDALELVRQVRGLDFPAAVVWLAEREGLDASPWQTGPKATGGAASEQKAARAPLTPLPPSGPPPPATWAEGAAAETWERLEGRQVDGAAAYLEGRGIAPALVRSGFAFLDAGAVELVLAGLSPAWLDEETRPGVPRRQTVPRWLRHHQGAALAVPLRSAATGRVEALHVRAFKPRGPNDKRRTLGALRDEDGAPRGYGFAGEARAAAVLVLVEGMADALAAEAMTQGAPGAVVVGADSAGALEAWGDWLATHKPSGRVVVVSQVDAREAGQKATRAAREALQRAAVPCPVFDWRELVRGIRARGEGLDELAAREGFDLADVLASAPFDVVRAAFRQVLGLPAVTTSAAPPPPPPSTSAAPPPPPPSTRAAPLPQPAPLEAHDDGGFWEGLEAEADTLDEEPPSDRDHATTLASETTGQPYPCDDAWWQGFSLDLWDDPETDPI